MSTSADVRLRAVQERVVHESESGVPLEERILDIDRRLLPLRGDQLACRFFLEACHQAIERLESYAEVTAGRTRVPVLALARLRSVYREWESVASQISQQMDVEVEPLREAAKR